MAIGQISIEVILDQSYKDQIAQAQADFEAFGESVSESLSSLGTNAFADLSTQLDALTESLATFSSTLSDQVAAITEVTDALNGNISTTGDAATAMDSANESTLTWSDSLLQMGVIDDTLEAQVSALVDNFIAMQEAMSATTASTEDLSVALADVTTEEETATTATEGVNAATTGYGGGLNQLLLPLLGVGLAVKSSIQNFSDYDNALHAVQATTGLTNSQLQELGQTVQQIAETTGTKTTDLLGVADLGGQLGIPNQDLGAFVSNINKLNVAIGASFNESIGQFATEIGAVRVNAKDLASTDPAQAILQIGNALDTLSTSGRGKSTPAGIAEITNRLIDLEGQTSLTTPQILGFADSLQTLTGGQTERVASSMNTLITTFSKNDTKIASFLGESVQSVDEQLNNNLSGTLINVAKHFNDLHLSTAEQSKELAKLGITGQYPIEMFRLLGENSDYVIQRQQLAGQALSGTSKVMAGFTDQNQDASHQLAALGQKFNDLSISIGQSLAPALLSIGNAIYSVVSPLVSAFENLPQPVRTALISVAGLAGVFVGLLSGMRFVGTIASALGPELSALGTFITSILPGATLLSNGFILLGIVLAALTLKKLGFFDFLKAKIADVASIAYNTIETIVKAFQSPQVQSALKNLESAFDGFIKLLKPLLAPLEGLISAVLAPLDAQAKKNHGSLISLGEAISIVSKAFNAVATVLKDVTDFFNKNKAAADILHAVLSAMGGIIAYLAGALGILTGVVVGLSIAMGILDIALGIGATLFAIITSPVTLVVIGIIALIAAIILLVEHWKQIEKVAKEAWDNALKSIENFATNGEKHVGKFFSNIGKFFTDLKNSIGKDFTTAFTTAEKGVSSFVSNVVKFFQGLLKDIHNIISNLVSTISKNWEKWLLDLVAILAYGVGRIIKAIIDLPENISKLFHMLVHDAVKIWNTLWADIVKIVNTLVRDVIGFFLELPSNIGKVHTQLHNDEVSAWNKIWSDITSIVKTLINDVVAFFQSLPTTLTNIQNELLKLITQGWTAIWNGIKLIANNIWKDVKSIFTSLINDITTIIHNAPSDVTKAFTGLLTAALNFGKNFITNISNGIKGALKDIGGIGNFLGGLLGSIGSTASSSFSAGLNGQNLQLKATGGIIYASEGTYLGTDTVPAMLTPGEMVLPRSMSYQFLSLLRQMATIPNMAKGINSSAAPSGISVNMNVGSIYAGSTDAARRRAMDINWMIGNNLRAQGINL